MSLTTPYLINIPMKAFDAAKDNMFEFISTGGNQIAKHEIEIQDNTTNLQVYLKTELTFQFEHTLPANTLTNGNQYKIRIRTYDIDDNFSEWSRWELFNCFSTPLLTIPNIDEGLVNNTNYEFIGNYSQLEGEELESYKFFLYDVNGSLIAASTQKYSTDIRHSFSGLQDDEEYRIELKAETLHGMEISTGKIYFRVNYITPQLGAALILENIFKDGQVKVTSNIIDVVGKSNPSPPPYINKEMVDLRQNGSWVKFDEGFTINKDFTLKLWCKNLKDNTTFLEMYGERHTKEKPYKIQLIYHLHRIHLYKVVNDQKYYLYSQELHPLNDDMFFIWLQSKNNLIDLKCELVKAVV